MKQTSYLFQSKLHFSHPQSKHREGIAIALEKQSESKSLKENWMAMTSNEGLFLKVEDRTQGSQTKLLGRNLNKLMAQAPGCFPSGKTKLKKEVLGHIGIIRTPFALYNLKCIKTATMS